MAAATWTLEGDQLTIRAADFGYEATFTLTGDALVSAGGERYARADCR